jgi:hypothetical protein
MVFRKKKSTNLQRSNRKNASMDNLTVLSTANASGQAAGVKGGSIIWSS